MHRNTPAPKALELIPLTSTTAHILPSLALLGLLLGVEALRRPRALEVQQAPDAVAPRVGVQVAALTLGQRGIISYEAWNKRLFYLFFSLIRSVFTLFIAITNKFLEIKTVGSLSLKDIHLLPTVAIILAAKA